MAKSQPSCPPPHTHAHCSFQSVTLTNEPKNDADNCSFYLHVCDVTESETRSKLGFMCTEGPTSQQQHLCLTGGSCKGL